MRNGKIILKPIIFGLITTLVSKAVTLLVILLLTNLLFGGLFKSTSIVFVIDSTIRVILYLIIIYTFYVILKKGNIKNPILYPISYLAFTFAIQLATHLVSISINNSSFELARTIPELELIAGGIFFIFYKYIKNEF